jgi:diacylglycerol kinase family enzyme
MGMVNGQHFILRVGVGFEAAMVENADRELKNRFGVFAYLWSAVQNLTQPVIAHYRLNIDGKEFETDGLTCIIANSGNLGQAGINLIPTINVCDGLLDVIVVQQANLRSLFDLLGSITGLKQVQGSELLGQTVATNLSIKQTLQYWQAKEVIVSATPEQTAQSDGEILGKVPVHCHILPAAVQVITPKPAA